MLEQVKWTENLQIDLLMHVIHLTHLRSILCHGLTVELSGQVSYFFFKPLSTNLNINVNVTVLGGVLVWKLIIDS